MKCHSNTPISLHKTTSPLFHQPCYLTFQFRSYTNDAQYTPKALWEGGTRHSQIHLYNHSFKSHGCSYIEYMKFQSFCHVEPFTMPDYIDTPLSMFLSENYISTRRLICRVQFNILGELNERLEF